MSAHKFKCPDCGGSGEWRDWLCDGCWGSGEIILECDGCDECPEEEG